jgi:hypothetical protein
MKRYKIRRMAERLAVKIIRNLPLDRFEQELWHLAAIIEEHLFSELVQLDEAERRTEETEANALAVKAFCGAATGNKGLPESIELSNGLQIFFFEFKSKSRGVRL